MKNLLLTMFSFLLLFNILIAQQTDNWQRYNSEKKEPALAGLLEVIVPLVGHAYAGDISRGVVPTLISGGGLVLMFASVGSAASGDLAGFTSTYGLGLLAYLGGRVYGVISAVQTANDFNNDLKRKLNLSIVPLRNPDNSFVVGLDLKFNF